MRALKRVSVLSALVMGGALSIGCGPSEFDLPMDDLTPEQGLSLRIPTFEVPYGDELQDCYFMEVPDLMGDGSDLWVDRTKIGMNPGSHHFNMYRVTTETELRPENGEDFDLNGIPSKLIKGGACKDSSNFNEWPLIMNSQQSDPEDPYLDWTLPEGVAYRLTPGELIMLQPHYVNVGEQTTPFRGQVKVNFYRTDIEDPMELGTLFATQQSIRVCQSTPEAKYSGTCSFSPDQQVRIAALNGHFHLRGREFTVATWDGQSIEEPSEEDVFYTSTSWEDPVMDVNIDVEVPQGGGIWWNCNYEWTPPTSGGCEAVNEYDEEQQGDCCFTFGPNVSWQEHCNVFLYYYPKQDQGDIFCN